jgi:hypothetical protein
MTMRSATTLLWLLAGMPIAFGLPSPAAASCNAIPARPVVFRGARGAIDRPFIQAGEDISLSPACGSQPFPTPPAHVTVTIIAKSPATGSVQIDAMAGPGSELKFQVPKKQLDFAGPVALAVTSAVAPPGQPTPLPDLAAKRCRDFQRSDLFVCIDELFTSDGGSCGTDADPVFAAVTALPAQKNDFRKMCVKDSGEDPRCNGAAEPSYAVYYTLDTSGNVLLSMSWGNILRQKGGGNKEKDRRWVQGSVLERFLSSGSPIEIPSEAFLDSFNPVGTSFSPKPIFLPGVLPEPTPVSGQATAAGVQTPTLEQPATPTPKEVAFYGTADKDTSVLRIARRKLWSNACSGPINAGQACEQPSDCPGGTCVSQPPASYFACHQGLRDKLPCTRPQHCPQGQCLRVTQLYCSDLSGKQTLTPCTTDSNCGPGQDCGLWLFNLSSKLKNGIGMIPRDKYHARAGHY